MNVLKDFGVDRQKRPVSFWQEAVSEYEQGTEVLRSFCQRKGFALSTFHTWRKKLSVSSEVQPGFIPVQIKDPQEEAFVPEKSLTPFVLHIGRRMRLEISKDFDAEALKRLIPCLC